MAKAKTKQYLIKDEIIIDEIYPIAADRLKTKSNAFKKCIERFIQSRHDSLYDYAPVDRIYFRKPEVDDFFKTLNIDQKEISKILPTLYYWNDDEIQACKDEFSLTCLMCLRYYLKEKKNDKTMIELTAVYLAFSGKFYASCHTYWWRKYTPNRQIMDYVVNYMLSQKFDLIKTRSVFGAVRNLAMTWVDTYGDELADPITDERISYLLHQLRGRILAFLKNIAIAYYEANDKKLYLNAESDSFDEDNYRIANTNSSIISNITEKTMIYFVNNQININICYQVSQSGVDPYDIKAIFENILNSNEYLDQLRFVINVMLMDFITKYPDAKDITGPSFISHSISMKPNTKDENILKTKNIILGWLSTSERYNRIKTPATKNNYYKAILAYIAITINNANKQ